MTDTHRTPTGHTPSTGPEAWRTIPYAPRYQASDHGRIRRVLAWAEDGSALRTRPVSLRVLRGRLVCNLRGWSGEKTFTLGNSPVSRAVATAFHLDLVPGQGYLTHRNHDTTDCTLVNLSWSIEPAGRHATPIESRRDTRVRARPVHDLSGPLSGPDDATPSLVPEGMSPRWEPIPAHGPQEPHAVTAAWTPRPVDPKRYVPPPPGLWRVRDEDKTRLTNEEVSRIHAMYRKGGGDRYTIADIADSFDVSPSTVWRVLHNTTYMGRWDEPRAPRPRAPRGPGPAF